MAALNIGPHLTRAIREQLDGAGLPVLGEIVQERARQDEKWGEQNHPDVPTPRSITTDRAYFAGRKLGLPSAKDAKAATDDAASQGRVTWGHIAAEELAEAVEAAAVGDEAALCTELVQLAAVCVQWVQAIDRRAGTAEPSRDPEALTGPDAAPHKCPKCDGCGRIGTDDEQAPWTFWESLPPGSDLAVRLGFVRPIDCPECGGSGSVTR